MHRASPSHLLLCEEEQLRLPTMYALQIITGFLGSGKTTLLNHILTQKHGRRIAVIENEVSSSLSACLSPCLPASCLPAYLSAAYLLLLVPYLPACLSTCLLPLHHVCL